MTEGVRVNPRLSTPALWATRGSSRRTEDESMVAPKFSPFEIVQNRGCLPFSPRRVRRSIHFSMIAWAEGSMSTMRALSPFPCLTLTRRFRASRSEGFRAKASLTLCPAPSMAAMGAAFLTPAGPGPQTLISAFTSSGSRASLFG